MSDYSETWELVRKRFVNELKDLNQEQLNWKLHPQALSIGEMAVHVAGVEVFFISQLLKDQLDEFANRLTTAARDGVVNDNPFPYKPEEITPDLVKKALDHAEQYTAPVIQEASQEIRGRELVSALGPVIDGNGAFARLAYHPSYHQGQVHLVKTAPGFPA